MMTRTERIEYEILDCALNRTRREWRTSIESFLLKIRELFPDAQREEVIRACKDLPIKGALTLRKVVFPGSHSKLAVESAYHDCHDQHKDDIFLAAYSELRFQPAALRRLHFQRLLWLVELPPASPHEWRKTPGLLFPVALFMARYFGVLAGFQ
jgi:hypothetical protein